MIYLYNKKFHICLAYIYQQKNKPIKRFVFYCLLSATTIFGRFQTRISCHRFSHFSSGHSIFRSIRLSFYTFRLTKFTHIRKRLLSYIQYEGSFPNFILFQKNVHTPVFLNLFCVDTQIWGIVILYSSLNTYFFVQSKKVGEKNRR